MHKFPFVDNNIIEFAKGYDIIGILVLTSQRPFPPPGPGGVGSWMASCVSFSSRSGGVDRTWATEWLRWAATLPASPPPLVFKY